jgi:hypothetical protein
LTLLRNWDAIGGLIDDDDNPVHINRIFRTAFWTGAIRGAVVFAHYAIDVIRMLNATLRCLPPSANWKTIRNMVIRHDQEEFSELLPGRTGT